MSGTLAHIGSCLSPLARDKVLLHLYGLQRLVQICAPLILLQRLPDFPLLLIQELPARALIRQLALKVPGFQAGLRN